MTQLIERQHSSEQRNFGSSIIQADDYICVFCSLVLFVHTVCLADIHILLPYIVQYIQLMRDKNGRKICTVTTRKERKEKIYHFHLFVDRSWTCCERYCTGLFICGRPPVRSLPAENTLNSILSDCLSVYLSAWHVIVSAVSSYVASLIHFFKGHPHASIMYQVSGKNSQPYEVNIIGGCLLY